MSFRLLNPPVPGALRPVVLALVLLTSACGGTPPVTPLPVVPPTSAALVAVPTLPPAAAGLAALTPQMHLPRLDGVTLRVLGWPDIYPTDLFTPFEYATGAIVERTGVFSTDELIANLSSAIDTPYDLISASADSIGSNIEQGLVQPIDVTKLTHYGNWCPT
jgi:spermidine/putrescine-binding protein